DGHFSAKCHYCTEAWSIGKPELLKGHLALHGSAVPTNVKLEYMQILIEQSSSSNKIQKINSSNPSITNYFDSSAEVDASKRERINQALELRDLYENLQELQIILWELLMKILKQKIIIETEVEDFHDDFDDEINNEVFSNVEIEKFKKIYNNEPIEESEINELKAENEKLKEKKEQAKNYIINIFKKSCCNKNCLEEIDQEVAILWFQNYINLTKDQQNMFLLRIISTSTSEYLTMAYVFDGVAICSSAFFKLYDLSKNRLIGLKNHYKDNDIVPKVHLSKGKKVSHNKFSFETILKVLTFLKIYANVNGHHFKRDTNAIIYLPTKTATQECMRNFYVVLELRQKIILAIQPL
ncbi:9820_t:CDS:2, partial [Entrophospora sp. SA101]